MKNLLHTTKSERIGSLILISILLLIFGVVIYIKSVQIPVVDSNMINEAQQLEEFCKAKNEHSKLMDSIEALNANNNAKKGKGTKTKYSTTSILNADIPLIED